MKLGVPGAVYFILCLVLMHFLYLSLHGRTIVYLLQSYAIIFLDVLGVVIAVWARILLGIDKMVIRSGNESKVLVTSGPYRFSRNPMYLFMLLTLLGNCFLMGFFTFLGPIAFWGVINFSTIPLEEQKLEAAFGEKYLEYKNRVPRWL